MVLPLLSSLRCQRVLLLPKEFFTGKKQPKAVGHTGVDLALAMANDPCFDPERACQQFPRGIYHTRAELSTCY